jgi:AraC-like DNA-binding protein
MDISGVGFDFFNIDCRDGRMAMSAGGTIKELSAAVRHDCPAAKSDDLLSEVLQDLRLARASYGRSELTAPWGVEIPYQEGVRFHFVAEGAICMLTASQDPLWLEAGDVVLLPHGTGHVIADEPRRQPQPLKELAPQLVGNSTYRLTGGGGGARSLIVCCTIAFDGPTAHPLLELLPDVLVVRRSAQHESSLPILLNLLASEVASQRIGAATIMTRLADIVMTQIVRAWIETRPSDLSGWPAAVRDPQIGAALARIHRQPGDAWTVETLAVAAGMSRSLFSERFATLLGVSPARYLLQWRMRLGAVWLKNETMTVAEIATRLGYASDAAFSRAFKRFMGVSPGSLRSRPAHAAATSASA